MSRTFKNILTLGIFSLVFLFSFLAFGQPCSDINVQLVNDTSSQQEWWMVLLDALLQLVAPLVIGVLGTLSSIAIRKWGKKMDVDTQERLIGITQNLITSGVAFAEEQGRKALKVGETQTEGSQKLQQAIDYIQERLNESQLPQIGTEKLQHLIESRLHAERSNPTGIVPNDPPLEVITQNPVEYTEILEEEDTNEEDDEILEEEE